MNLYFDHNATSPLRQRVREGIIRALKEGIGANPSSVHREGRKAKKHLENARQNIAKHFSCAPSQILFTSGACESIRIAWEKYSHTNSKILTSPIEHSCVLSSAKKAQRQGSQVDVLKVLSSGALSDSAAKHDYDFISLQKANNETGLLYDLSPYRSHLGPKGVMFCDAVQAAGKTELSFSTKPYDLMAIAGHKLGALSGIGMLIFKDASMIEPILEGSQERGLRAGTENLLGILSVDYALQELKESGEKEQQSIRQLRDDFEKELKQRISDIEITGEQLPRLYNTSHVQFRGLDGESLVTALDLEGFCVSMGSACSSGTIEPSHVLLAMGMSRKSALSSLRFSFGWNHRQEDIEKLLDSLPAIVDRVRKG
ncbi:MAG: cysteine desulfurase [Bdellovibrionales bacterium]|nr:cysteine desulfurase [Bdellovibrionales bacterium]